LLCIDDIREIKNKITKIKLKENEKVYLKYKCKKEIIFIKNIVETILNISDVHAHPNSKNAKWSSCNSCYDGLFSIDNEGKVIYTLIPPKNSSVTVIEREEEMDIIYIEARNASNKLPDIDIMLKGKITYNKS